MNNHLNPSGDVASLLRIAGWRPERHVDANDVISEFTSKRIASNEFARRVIHALHPLSVRTPSLAMSFDALDAATYVDSRDLSFLEESVGPNPCPVGIFQGGPLVVIGDGRTVWLDDIGVGYSVFDDFESALEELVSGKAIDRWLPLPD